MTSSDNTDIIPCNALPFVSQSLTLARYKELYDNSVNDPQTFWGDIAGEFQWKKRWDDIDRSSFLDDVSIRWFDGGLLNITENCLDRHLETRGDKPAYIWEGDDPAQHRVLTYRELYGEVNRFANGLRALGVKKGDRVTLYMPQIPESVVAMLACARIGAVHSVVFAGFSADSVRSRIEDCDSDVIITADAAMRGGKSLPLKAQIDKAIEGLNIRHVIVFTHVGISVEWERPRDISWQDVINGQPDTCAAEAMASEDPLFILYTSGSTGKPKGLLHTVAGYMVYVATTLRYAFDLREEDIYWCTADIGWITGHSYMVYAPLLNGTTSVLFEGIPTYPDASRYWQVVDKYRVSIFYTAPTAVRSLMRLGDAPVTETSRASLRVLGSVGEPINPEAWLWYFRVVGESRCPIVDTWWQTETGGHMILPLPGITPQKPGAASWPFFGVIPELYSADGARIDGAGEGMLCIARSWPGQARTIWGDHDRFRKTYFSTIKGAYFTSDGARRDEEGYYWITGRVDDVINVSGHRLGTAEIESALVAHPDVAEAAVVGVAHEVKGQAIYAYVIVNASVETTDAAALKLWVRKQIGGLAVPEVIHFTPALPKTRSGKIMRRILRKIADGDVESLGDTSTLMNPEIIAELLAGREA
jgi:acetyl-CoA synthetase